MSAALSYVEKRYINALHYKYIIIYLNPLLKTWRPTKFIGGNFYVIFFCLFDVLFSLNMNRFETVKPYIIELLVLGFGRERNKKIWYPI